MAKQLNEKQRSEVIEKYAEGVKVARIAKMYGVSRFTIYYTVDPEFREKEREKRESRAAERNEQYPYLNDPGYNKIMRTNKRDREKMNEYKRKSRKLQKLRATQDSLL